MAKKRDYLEEIISKKSRIHKSKRWDLVISHFRAMQKCIEILDIVAEEEDYLEEKHSPFIIFQIDYLDSFFPIKCVACVEGYFRLIYAHLIDFGDPFRNNAKKFSEIKISIDTVLSLDIVGVSAGDFISHLLPIKSFETIDSVMSTLIGEDFKDKLKAMYFKTPHMLDLFGKDEDVFSNIIKVISEMFKLRHIYCHELGSPTNIIASPYGFVESTTKFLHLTELIIEELTEKKIGK
jgi:hypothetical protein